MVRLSKEEAQRVARETGQDIEVELAVQGHEQVEHTPYNKYGVAPASERVRVCHQCMGRMPELALCPVCRGVGTIRFDSKAEADRYDELTMMQAIEGTISGLELQPEYSLHTLDGVRGTIEEVCKYRADFRYLVHYDPETGVPAHIVVEDVKGHKTPMYQLKKKWLRLEYGIVIVEVQR